MDDSAKLDRIDRARIIWNWLDSRDDFISKGGCEDRSDWMNASKCLNHYIDNGNYSKFTQNGAHAQTALSRMGQIVVGLCLFYHGKRLCLDLGCGVGYPIHVLSRFGYDTWGIDIDEKIIGSAKELLGKGLDQKVLVGSFEDKDFPEKMFGDRKPSDFDLFFCYGPRTSIDWGYTVNDQIKAAESVMKRDGIIIVPSLDCLPASRSEPNRMFRRMGLDLEVDEIFGEIYFLRKSE